MKTEFPKCKVEVTFQIPSSVNFQEKRQIALEGFCADIAKIIQDNLVRETQTSDLKGKAAIQIKEHKIEHYTLQASSGKPVEAKHICSAFAKLDSYSRSNLLSRVCKGWWMQFPWKRYVVITREKDTVVK